VVIILKEPCYNVAEKSNKMQKNTSYILEYNLLFLQLKIKLEGV